MTEDIDTLLAIAEIAGVFVGFAALVTVVSSRSGAERRHVDAFRLVCVVVISTQVIAAALVPIVLDRFGLSQSTIWRISGGLILVANCRHVHIRYVEGVGAEDRHRDHAAAHRVDGVRVAARPDIDANWYHAVYLDVIE